MGNIVVKIQSWAAVDGCGFAGTLEVQHNLICHTGRQLLYLIPSTSPSKCMNITENSFSHCSRMFSILKFFMIL